ncbi:MAG: hypothetical protein EBY09_12595 [Verrucomicrobia bacterium]|nr:hypothetical protein [Verrucomicrobiota bacterium]
MVPAVPLGHPHEFLGVIKPVQELLAAVTEERLAFLVDDRLGRSGFPVHSEDAEDLMPALIVTEREPL